MAQIIAQKKGSKLLITLGKVYTAFRHFSVNLAILWIYLSGLCGQVLAKSEYFRSGEVSGEVLILKPWNFFWEPVLPRRSLPENALIQLKDQAKLVLYYKSVGRGKLESKQFVFKDSNVFRLDLKTLKSVKHKKYYFHHNPLNDDDDFFAFARQKIILDMQDAWNRVSAMHYLKPGSRESEKMKNYQDFLTELNAFAISDKKKIEIILPHPLSSYKSVFFPLSVWCYWKDNRTIVNPQKPQYYVYLWKPGQQRGRPKYLSYRKEMFLPVKKNGAWFLQVESTDLRYSSPPVLFKVSKGQSAKTFTTNLSEEIFSDSPEDQSYFYTAKTSIPIWFKGHSSPANHRFYYLNIRDPKDKRYKSKKISAGGQSVSLPPGHWLWALSLKRPLDHNDDDTGARSEERSLHIEGSVNLTKIIRQSLSRKLSGAHYLPSSDP